MRVTSGALRDAVIERADNRCEYCQLPAQLQVGGFEIDHIEPRSRGGQTLLSNLALACPNYNAHKWSHIDGEAPETGQHELLFNPRRQRWGDHFEWSEHRSHEIVGISAQGRATVSRLQMHHPDLVRIRYLLDELGIQWGRTG
jgi:hypothetical protein